MSLLIELRSGNQRIDNKCDYCSVTPTNMYYRSRIERWTGRAEAAHMLCPACHDLFIQSGDVSTNSADAIFKNYFEEVVRTLPSPIDVTSCSKEKVDEFISRLSVFHFPVDNKITEKVFASAGFSPSAFRRLSELEELCKAQLTAPRQNLRDRIEIDKNIGYVEARLESGRAKLPEVLLEDRRNSAKSRLTAMGLFALFAVPAGVCGTMAQATIPDSRWFFYVCAGLWVFDGIRRAVRYRTEHSTDIYEELKGKVEKAEKELSELRQKASSMPSRESVLQEASQSVRHVTQLIREATKATA